MKQDQSERAGELWCYISSFLSLPGDKKPCLRWSSIAIDVYHPEGLIYTRIHGMGMIGTCNEILLLCPLQDRYKIWSARPKGERVVAGKHPKMALLFPVPIGSMYAIYGNIHHQYTPNVTIHGSYGVESSSVSQVAGLESDEVAAHKCVLASRREPRGCHLGPWWPWIDLWRLEASLAKMLLKPGQPGSKGVWTTMGH